MRTIAASIFALLFAGTALPATADPATEQLIREIRSWEPIYATANSMFYMSPEDQNDGVPGHTYRTAEVFLDGPEAVDDGDPLIWGWMAVREYDCANQTMTVKNYGEIGIDGVQWDNEVLTPTKREEIRADDGIRDYKMACGWN